MDFKIKRNFCCITFKIIYFKEGKTDLADLITLTKEYFGLFDGDLTVSSSL